MVGLSAFCISSEYSSWILTCIQIGNSQTTSLSSSSGACWSVCFLYLQCWALNRDLTHTFKSWFTSTACFLDLFSVDYWIIGWFYIYMQKNTGSYCVPDVLSFSGRWHVTMEHPSSISETARWAWVSLRLTSPLAQDNLKYCTRVHFSLFLFYTYINHLMDITVFSVVVELFCLG